MTSEAGSGVSKQALFQTGLSAGVGQVLRRCRVAGRELQFFLKGVDRVVPRVKFEISFAEGLVYFRTIRLTLSGSLQAGDGLLGTV